MKKVCFRDFCWLMKSFRIVDHDVLNFIKKIVKTPFLIYIDDRSIFKYLSSTMFVDDTNLYDPLKNITILFKNPNMEKFLNGLKLTNFQ